MNRSAWVHLALLGAALVAAYLVWTREPTPSEDTTVKVLSLPQLQRVQYEDTTHKVTISRRSDKTGDYDWVKVEKLQTKRTPVAPVKSPQAPSPQPASASAAANPPKPPRMQVTKTWQPKDFKGNRTAGQLFAALTELPALRALGKVDAAKLKEFGLAMNQARLTLTSGSINRTFLIGGQTFGNMDRYIEDKGDQRVYIVHQRLLKDLEDAEHRLFEPQLHAFETKDFDRVVVQSQGARKVLIQHKRDTPATAFWTEEGATDTGHGKDVYRNWLIKLFRLHATDYTDPNAPPKGLKPHVNVSYYDRGKQIGFLELSDQVTLVPGTVAAAPGGASDYYATTESTRVPVRVAKPLAQQLVNEVDALLKD